MEKRIYFLEKRRLGSDFCDKEFISGSETDRREKYTHIRDNHTFKCNVCDIQLKNKEGLDVKCTFVLFVTLDTKYSVN